MFLKQNYLEKKTMFTQKPDSGLHHGSSQSTAYLKIYVNAQQKRISRENFQILVLSK